MINKNKIAIIIATLLPCFAHANLTLLPPTDRPEMVEAPTVCPSPIAEDHRIQSGAISVRVTITEQGSDKVVRVISLTPSKSIKNGLTHPVIWKNTGVTDFVTATYPILRERSQGFEKVQHLVCSFGKIHLFAKAGKDGKATITFSLQDRIVAGIAPAFDHPSGASAELPIYAEETLKRTFPLEVGDKASIKWHAPETSLPRVATIERLK